MEKNLRNMPPAVFHSALYYKDTWYSRPVVRLVEWTSGATQLVSALTRWALFFWWILGATPFFEESFASSRSTVLKFLAALLAAAAVTFYLDILTHKPLAERGWPCAAPVEPLFAGAIRVNGLREAFRFGTAWPAIVYGLLLLVSTAYSARGDTPVVWMDVAYAAAALGIGVLGILMDLYPPSFGVKIPTWGEFHSARAEHERRQTEVLEVQSTVTNRDQDYVLPVSARHSDIRFADIFGMKVLKEKLIAPARAIMADRSDLKDAPRNGVLLHGEPGNGKTIFAEALAGELEVPIIALTYGDVASKWIGEMPRVIANVFAYAKKTAPCVLFIDEIDSFVTSRDQTASSSEDMKITNTLLTEIVNVRSHKVVLVGATNYLQNLDAAAIREGRFDFKVEVTPPDEQARLGLLQQGIARHAAGIAFDEAALRSVTSRWNGFSVSRLMAVTKAIPSVMANQSARTAGFKDWMTALREVQGRQGRVPDNTRSLEELILPTNTKEALGMLASRLQDAHRIESMGGTLPTGVLLHGPSGTGKTAAARALAKETGWAFLSVAGPDLLSDCRDLDKLFAEARDLRPTIVFIDEAEDVLRNRQVSVTPELCNKLLVLMDGTEERVRDVVVMAATNHPEQIDPALLRAGRFTEKVAFMPPPASDLPRFLSGWFREKKTPLSADLDVFDLADVFAGHTIADIEGSLQYALNCAVAEHRGPGRREITWRHINMARTVVLQASDERSCL